MTPAAYVLRVNRDGKYSLVIWGAIKYDGLTFAEAITKISEAEKMKEDKKNV